MRLFNLFKKNKRNNDEFAQLNDICNSAFEGIFNKYRLNFGREMVEIMDLKSGLLEVVKSVNSCTPVQETIAKKFLELIPVYFRLIEVCVSVKNGNLLEKEDSQTLNRVEEKMGTVYCLLITLNRQFYLSSEAVADMSAFDEIINEAEALRNVVNNSYFKNI
jgi:hypothetical protein